MGSLPSVENDDLQDDECRITKKTARKRSFLNSYFSKIRMRLLLHRLLQQLLLQSEQLQQQKPLLLLQSRH